MAGSQARTRLFLTTFAILALVPVITLSYDSFLKDLPTHVFQRHLKVSRHNPFCIVFREQGAGSKLEKSVYEIWKKTPPEANFTKWELGAFSTDKTKLPPKCKQPDKLPSLQCYLGETSKYQYRGKVSKSGLKEWLNDLNELHEEQNQEVSEEMLDEAMKKYHIILLAFPDGPRHHQVEDMMYELAASLDSCKAMAVHLNYPHVMSLRERFDIKKYPSVVVIHNHRKVKGNRTKIISDNRVFGGLDAESHILKLFVKAKALDVPFLNMETFNKLVTREDSSTWKFRPVIVCFYNSHGRDVTAYLDAFEWTVTQFRQDRVKMRYGLIDLSEGFIPQLINSHVQGVTMKKIPFLSLFYKEKDGSLKHSELYIDRPYPWVMYQPLQGTGLGIADKVGLVEYQPPWGIATFDQFSSLQEGPKGSLCTPWSSNQTDNNPKPRKVKVKTTKVIRKPAPVPKDKKWHDMFDSGSLEKKLFVLETIPLLTLETWSDVVEKSHAPRHIFYSSGRWAGEVTKVSMVVFIMAECGNCQRKNETFQEIQEAVSHIDGGAMYYVNCTAEPTLCQQHNIRGYPTISAFRGLGWMGTKTCLSASSQKKFKKFVRLDFHGPIMTSYVMDWFSTIAHNAVTNLKYEKPGKQFKTKDVRIVATILPNTALKSDLTDNSTVSMETFSYKCLRLLCERLYSLLDCYTRYSALVPAAGYDTDDVELYVSKIYMERRDGVIAPIMKHGEILHDTFEDKTTEDLHQFHFPHNYDLAPDQTCESDPGACTDALVEFILDHSRMPVTQITSDMFHTSTSSLREERLPILIALAHPENLTASADFMKTLTSIAYEFYNRIMVMTLDTKVYTVWATSFVPVKYGKIRAFTLRDPDPYQMYVYPRLCIVQRHDHNHAALYPHIKQVRKRTDFNKEAITEFLTSYLESPSNWIIETEHF